MLSDKIKDYLNEYISQEVYVQVAVAKGKNKISTNAAISKYFESNHFQGLAEGKPYNTFLDDLKDKCLGKLVNSPMKDSKSDDEIIIELQKKLNTLKIEELNNTYWEVGMGTKSKLLNNFLTLGNATLIIHMIKSAEKFDIDLKKLYDVAKLGSGNSAALSRIFDNLLKDDYTGFKFTAKNSHKDMSYIQDLLKDMPDAEKLAKDTKDFYKDAMDSGNGELFISELIKK